MADDIKSPTTAITDWAKVNDWQSVDLPSAKEATQPDQAVSYQKKLADSFSPKNAPKTGDPGVGGQSKSEQFRQAGPEGKWQIMKDQGYPIGNIVQAVGGIGNLVGRNRTGDQKMMGASDLVRGAGPLAAPFLLPAAIASAPATTAASLIGGTVSQQVAQDQLDKNRDLGPGARNLGSDLAGLVGGGITGGITKLGLGGLAKLYGGKLGALGSLVDLIRNNAATGSVAPKTAIPAAPQGTMEPLASNTNSLRPAGTGAPPGPFNPNQPVTTGTTVAPMSPTAILERALQAKNLANVSPLAGVKRPGGIELPAALNPQESKFATSRLLQGARTSSEPNVVPNRPPISSEAQVMAQTQAMLKQQQLDQAAAKAGFRAGQVPTAVVPPAMQHQLPGSPVKPPTKEEILDYILQSLTKTK